VELGSRDTDASSNLGQRQSGLATVTADFLTDSGVGIGGRRHVFSFHHAVTSPWLASGPSPQRSRSDRKI
jgi:hypothetical protein